MQTQLLKKVLLLSVNGGKWESENLPNVSYIIQSYDTAFSKENADYSAISTWGD